MAEPPGREALRAASSAVSRASCPVRSIHPASLFSSQRSSVMNAVAQQAVNDNIAVRPFYMAVPEADLIDLRRRIGATRFPESEPADDPTLGVRLATILKLARYWMTGYDWRKVE